MIWEPGRVFIANFVYFTTEEDIETIFEKFGAITNITVATSSTCKQGGFAYATLTPPKHAVVAMSALYGKNSRGDNCAGRLPEPGYTKKDQPEIRHQYRHRTGSEHKDPERQPQTQIVLQPKPPK